MAIVVQLDYYTVDNYLFLLYCFGQSVKLEIQTTLRYVHVRHEHIRAVVSPLDKLLVK